jgi:hypothetical protein
MLGATGHQIVVSRKEFMYRWKQKTGLPIYVCIGGSF